MNARTLADLACASQHCITCSDDGDAMVVVGVDRERGLALCNAQDGMRASVEIALVEPVLPGELLLVHAGTAIARLRPGERETVS